MNRNIDRITRLYHWFLRLYPTPFRKKFAAEMSEVFQSALEDSSSTSHSARAIVCLREIWEYPSNLIRQHWIQFTKQELIMTVKPNPNDDITCPRCQHTGLPDAKYCHNCGRAFIPIREHLSKQYKMWLKRPVTLLIIAVAILLFQGNSGDNGLLFDSLYHPHSLALAVAALTLGAVIVGWRWTRSGNSSRVKLIILATIVLQLSYASISYFDDLMINSLATVDQTIVYSLPGSHTELQGMFTDIGNAEQPPNYIKSIDCPQKAYVCMIGIGPSQHINTAIEGPHVLIKRYWVISSPSIYAMVLMAYAVVLIILVRQVNRRFTGGLVQTSVSP